MYPLDIKVKVIDREKIKLKVQLLRKAGKSTYIDGGTFFNCMICETSQNHEIYVRERFCPNCNMLLDEEE